MQIWQLQEAKAKFSEVIKLSQKEPQIVSVQGQNEAVILSIDDYNALLQNKQNFVNLIRESPIFDSALDFVRDGSSSREVNL